MTNTISRLSSYRCQHAAVSNVHSYSNSLFNTASNTVFIQSWESLKEELGKNYTKIARVNLEDLIVGFSKIIKTLISVNATSIYTQVTSVYSLVIKAVTSQGNLYAEMFFDESAGWLNEVVVNIFNKQRLDFNNTGSLEAMTLAIKQYFDIVETDYFTIMNPVTTYELSAAAFATADF